MLQLEPIEMKFQRIQRGFENQYNAYVKLKRENIQISDYETLQACKRMQGHVIYES